MTKTTGVQQTECQKHSTTGEENLVVNSVKSGRKNQQKENRNVVIFQSGESIVYSIFTTVFLEMGEKFVENDVFKDFGQK